MLITDKQVFKLMSICRRYANVCGQMGWRDDHDECKDLHRAIEAQQSEELKEAVKATNLIVRDETFYKDSDELPEEAQTSERSSEA